MITLHDYWMGRDLLWPAQLVPQIQINAEETVRKANLLILRYQGHYEGRKVNSGWRPPQVNANTPGAALRSKHMTGQAIDISDPDGDLDEWCLENPQALAELGLWLEHPSATKGWCHVQTIPPRSGNRIFYP